MMDRMTDAALSTPERSALLALMTFVSAASKKPPRIRVDWSAGEDDLSPEGREAVSWSHKEKFAVTNGGGANPS